MKTKGDETIELDYKSDMMVVWKVMSENHAHILGVSSKNSFSWTRENIPIDTNIFSAELSSEMLWQIENVKQVIKKVHLEVWNNILETEIKTVFHKFFLPLHLMFDSQKILV